MPANQTAVQGEDNVIRIHDGADPGTMLEIEYQGDATYNNGVTQNLKRYKNGSLPYRSKDGTTLNFTMGKVRPLSAGQQRLWDVAESGELVQAEYDDPNSGGQKRSGIAQFSMGSEKAGTNDNVEVDFTLAFVDDPTTAVNP
ncbi:hypothetical protein [Leisingera sp. M658]|uniref:hypothetical protein n=1 Tax=Leisingera sp. M658 TaxID=2867015 RepID=UPI0021A4EEC1|nr:hypothetical protein [Leisingera sp. M658]UWQ77355.1 hypothetical protein K3724_22735 [Leisingera sp. M658]